MNTRAFPVSMPYDDALRRFPEIAEVLSGRYHLPRIVCVHEGSLEIKEFDDRYATGHGGAYCFWVIDGDLKARTIDLGGDDQDCCGLLVRGSVNVETIELGCPDVRIEGALTVSRFINAREPYYECGFLDVNGGTCTPAVIQQHDNPSLYLKLIDPETVARIDGESFMSLRRNVQLAKVVHRKAQGNDAAVERIGDWEDLVEELEGLDEDDARFSGLLAVVRGV